LVGTKSDKIFESGDFPDDDDTLSPDRRRKADELLKFTDE